MIWPLLLGLIHLTLIIALEMATVRPLSVASQPDNVTSISMCNRVSLPYKNFGRAVMLAFKNTSIAETPAARIVEMRKLFFFAFSNLFMTTYAIRVFLSFIIYVQFFYLVWKSFLILSSHWGNVLLNRGAWQLQRQTTNSVWRNYGLALAQRLLYQSYYNSRVTHATFHLFPHHNIWIFGAGAQRL